MISCPPRALRSNLLTHLEPSALFAQHPIPHGLLHVPIVQDTALEGDAEGQAAKVVTVEVEFVGDKVAPSGFAPRDAVPERRDGAVGVITLVAGFHLWPGE